MTDDVEMLPCPFCGSAAPAPDETPHGVEAAHFVRCRCCAAEGPWAKSRAAAVMRWNGRSSAAGPETQGSAAGGEGVALTLDAMRALQRGWNGYEAEPPDPDVVAAAREYLDGLGVEPSRVAPSAVGGVVVTFRRPGKKVYVESYNGGGACSMSCDSGRVGTHPGTPGGDAIREFLDA